MLLAAASFCSLASAQQNEPLPNLDELTAAEPLEPEDVAALFAADGFTVGPAVGNLGNAEIKITPNWAFTDARGAKKWAADRGNPPVGNERGIMMPVADADDWIVFFSFDNIGYIEDAEKEDLDADKIYNDYVEGVKEQNKRLIAQGSTGYTLKGWKTSPHYEASTNTMEWSLLAEIDGQMIVNHEIRILGRKGVISATIACTPEELDRAALRETRKALTQLSFNAGESYAEYQSGDKIAKYGLAGLVGAGAIGLAAKSGFLGKLFKPILIGLAVVGGVIAKFSKSIFGGFSKERT